MRLTRDFFEKNTNTVSIELLGKVLNFNKHQIIITETESYIGLDDPACHANKGKTKRTAVMFGPAGFSYIYLIYGMYYCLNIVTEIVNFPAAVLIRGGREVNSPYTLLNGPGKLCRFLGINKNYNAIDITTNNEFYIKNIGLNLQFTQTSRIGINKGKDKLWRYCGIYSPDFKN